MLPPKAFVQRGIPAIILFGGIMLLSAYRRATVFVKRNKKPTAFCLLQFLTKVFAPLELFT